MADCCGCAGDWVGAVKLHYGIQGTNFDPTSSPGSSRFLCHILNREDPGDEFDPDPEQTNKQITQRGKEEMVDANIVLKNAIILLLIFRRNERITIFRSLYENNSI